MLFIRLRSPTNFGKSRNNTTGALLLTDDAEWTNRDEARKIYDLIKRYDNHTVVEGLVRRVINDEKNRLHVLLMAVDADERTVLSGFAVSDGE